MTTTIMGYGLEFLIQSSLLMAVLWFMIWIQKLNYSFLGLLGTAVVTTVAEMALDHFAGSYVSTGVVCGILSFCVWKMTRADQTDVMFTVMVGTALVFVLNLFLLGALMGDLNPSLENEELDQALEESQEEEPGDQRAELPAATNLVSLARSNTPVAPLPALAVAAPIGTNLADLVPKFRLKGVTKSKNISMALVHSGIKTYTISLGESVSMQTSGGPITVRCTAVEDNSAVLDVAGRQVSLSLQ